MNYALSLIRLYEVECSLELSYLNGRGGCSRDMTVDPSNMLIGLGNSDVEVMLKSRC
jgi:hypothetical protein